MTAAYAMPTRCNRPGLFTFDEGAPVNNTLNRNPNDGRWFSARFIVYNLIVYTLGELGSTIFLQKVHKDLSMIF